MASFIRKIFRFRPVYIAALIIIAGSFAYLVGIPFLDLMELKTIDLRFGSRGPAPTGSDVVLAVVDEKSIAREGKWVWPRSKFVDLVNKLSAAGAKVIAQAREALDMAQDRYRAGNGTQLEVLESQLQLTRAQLEQSVARHDLELALVQMQRATGRDIGTAGQID